MPQQRNRHNAHRKPKTTHTFPNGSSALRPFLTFLLSVLLANALIGERGLFASLVARRANIEFLNGTSRLKSENDRLRRIVHSLKKNSDAVEFIAREELGLISPGEKLFLLHNKGDPTDSTVSSYGPHY